MKKQLEAITDHMLSAVSSHASSLQDWHSLRTRESYYCLLHSDPSQKYPPQYTFQILRWWIHMFRSICLAQTHSNMISAKKRTLWGRQFEPMPCHQTSVFQQACEVLWDFCRHCYHAPSLMFLQASGIDLIVQQLCSHSLHNAWHAACVLANLAACNLSTYHDAIANAGALEPLLALLKGTKEEQSAALGALRNLTSDIKWQVSPFIRLLMWWQVFCFLVCLSLGDMLFPLISSCKNSALTAVSSRSSSQSFSEQVFKTQSRHVSLWYRQ